MDLIQYFHSHPLKITKVDSSETDSITLNGSINCSSPSAKYTLDSPVTSKVDKKSENSDTECQVAKKRSCPELTLTEKIDAIMESTKRKNKQIKHEMKYKRNRKTKDQIKMLSSELMEGIDFSTEKLMDISARTGLSKVQVYKWYWDYKNKKDKAE